MFSSEVVGLQNMMQLPHCVIYASYQTSNLQISTWSVFCLLAFFKLFFYRFCICYLYGHFIAWESYLPIVLQLLHIAYRNVISC